LLLAALLGVAWFPARAVRWWSLFPYESRPRLAACFTLLSTCNLVNILLPARGGDWLRCWLVRGERPGGSASIALATLVLEKTLDGFTLVAILLVAVVVLGPPGWVGRVAFLSGGLFLGIVAMLVALRLWPDRWLGLAQRTLLVLQLGRLSQRVRESGQRFVSGLAVVHSPSQLVLLAWLTAFIWVGDAMVTWWLARSMDVLLGVGAAALVSAIIGLGFMIPAGPASLGTYEAAAVAGLRLCGVELERALPLSLVLHACTLLVTTVLGLGGMAVVVGTLPRGKAERTLVLPPDVRGVAP
jgi:uncharacterized protein (TIRG00374 family)